MDVELFVHGVPCGEGFWGKEEDRNYFGTFYDHSSDEVKFLIQIRPSKGKPYCYYNYLVYKTPDAQTPNIVANDGRDGSYFGLTLRLDAYCKDIVNMYRILDTVYNVYVIGSLLKMEKTKLKYTTPDFASVSNILENIQKVTYQLIQNAFSNNSFTSLDGFATNGGNYPAYNLYDCIPDKVMANVKQYSRIAISPYYTSVKETTFQRQCDERIKANSDACAKEKNKIQESLKSVEIQAHKLRQDVEQKDEMINQLKKDISRLQSENRSIGQSKKVDDIVAPIKKPIVELASILGQMIPASTPKYMGEPDGTKQKNSLSLAHIIKLLLPIVNLMLLFVIIVALAVLLKRNKDNSRFDVLSAKIESLIAAENSTEQDLYTTSSEFDINAVVIDINGYEGGSLTLNTSYVVEARQGAENGTWEVEGCTKEQTEDSNIIKIIPTDKHVKITYCVGKHKKDRELTAK